jgi:hypothetical protein
MKDPEDFELDIEDEAMTPDHPAFRGVWASEDEYIRDQLAQHMPSYMAWVLEYCDPAKLREGYTGGKLHVWSVPAMGEGVLVFEAARRSSLTPSSRG